MPATPPTFLIKPQTQHVKEGETATLRCLCKGQPTPKVTWEKDGKTINPSSKHQIYMKNNFFCLDIVNADATDRGIFACVLTNSAGTTSEIADVDVAATIAATSPISVAGRSDSALAKAAMQQRPPPPPPDGLADEAGTAVTKDGGGLRCPVKVSVVAAPATTRKQPSPTGDELAAATADGSDGCRFRRALPLSPRFTKHLRTEEEVLEGETVVIEVKRIASFDERLQQRASRDSSAEERHVLPRFTKQLENCDVCEGDAVTLECRGQRPPPAVGFDIGAVECSCADLPETEAVGEPAESTATALSGGGGASTTPECAVVDAARPQFVKELVNVVLNEGDSVTLQCLTGAAASDNDSLLMAEAHSFASSPRDASCIEDAVRDRRGKPAEADARAYNAPLFIIQLPSALTLEEGANMDVSCHVNDVQVEALRCHDSSIASF